MQGTIHEAPVKKLTFRIGTPSAAERASAHEHEGSAARPVVEREALDIKDEPLYIVHETFLILKP